MLTAMFSILQMGKLRPKPARAQITIGGGSWARPRVFDTKSCFSLHQLSRIPPPPTSAQACLSFGKRHRFQKTPETVILPSYVNCAALRTCTLHAGPGAPGPHTLSPPAAASTHSSRSGTWRRRSAAASRLTQGSQTSSAASAGHFRSTRRFRGARTRVDSCPAWRCSHNCFTWGGGRWRASALCS